MTEKKALEVLKSWLQLAYQNADGTDECCVKLYEALQTVFALINRQKAEIERLQKEANLVSIQFQDLQERTDEIKAEAYKEFAERLKEKSFQSFGNYGITRDVVEVCDMDNLVKEMVSENNA